MIEAIAHRLEAIEFAVAQRLLGRGPTHLEAGVDRQSDTVASWVPSLDSISTVARPGEVDFSVAVPGTSDAGNIHSTKNISASGCRSPPCSVSSQMPSRHAPLQQSSKVSQLCPDARPNPSPTTKSSSTA
jgi:hypothetical protein